MKDTQILQHMNKHYIEYVSADYTANATIQCNCNLEFDSAIDFVYHLFTTMYDIYPDQKTLFEFSTFPDYSSIHRIFRLMKLHGVNNLDVIKIFISDSDEFIANYIKEYKKNDK